MWGLGPWMARQKLAGIIASSTYPGSSAPEENPPQYLRLLRRHPKLARQRFERRRNCFSSGAIFPLSFALEMGATLEVVKEVFDMNPLAANKKVIQNQSSYHSDYPLHHACQLGQVSPEVIQFLAHAAPRIVSSVNSCKHLPLHLILRNPRRSATFSEVETLLEIYEGAIERDCGFGLS